tara:strand:+ start:1731 stop:3623 length:1893 start_codon:yes stop_codon:yes gene_type:complete
MKLGNEVLSEIVVNTKYAKWNEEEQRKETWEEICNRNRDMHIKHINTLSIPQENKAVLEGQINYVYDNFVITKKVLPSMRSMQFAGKPVELSPNRIYNCAYMPIDNLTSFSEAMFLLLGGTGVGYSVQKHHVAKLPHIQQPLSDRTYRYKIQDSIEGWADAIKVLFNSYTGKRTASPRFDYSDIRPKGARLKTSGGKAPGPEPLRICLTIIEGMLRDMPNGHKMSSIQVHDMICHIADSVLAGGIRRAALISLFSADDEQMALCKSGNWWELNPQRGRANNSAVLLRHKLDKETFKSLMKKIEKSGSGEPGIYLSNDKDWGTNPCCEIALRPYQFCNLCEVNVSSVESRDDFLRRVEAASFLGTLQATYTDFHYLRGIWQRTTEKDALIGVSMTGIASQKVEDQWLSLGAEMVKATNKTYSTLLGIKTAARTTCVKPAGTTSCVLGTSSGIHAWYGEYFARRIRIGKGEAIYPYLVEKLPDLIEDDRMSYGDAVLTIPQKIPDETAIIRSDESAIGMLERIKVVSKEWVKNGHVRGNNSHNVSATVYVHEAEWKVVTKWLWENREYYNGMAFLPYDGGTYEQAPMEEISEDEYNTLVSKLHPIDLSEVKEYEDSTNLQGELACAGGVCEI